MDNKNENKYIPAFSKRHVAISIALCPLFILFYALLNEFVDIKWAFSAALSVKRNAFCFFL